MSELALPVGVPVGDASSDPFAVLRHAPASVVAPLTLVVVGDPAPQGSKRYVGSRNGAGKGRMIESSARVAPWRECVERAAQESVGWDPHSGRFPDGFAPLDGPLFAHMIFTMPKPKSAPKKRRSWPATHRNDLSKLIRSTEDALVTAGVIVDDGLIVEYGRAAKVFPGEDIDSLDVPGARIMVWTLSVLANPLS